MRQGDAIAPLLFNIVLKIAIRRSKGEKRGTIFDKCSLIMAYADNVLIMARRLQDVEEVFRSPVEKKTNKMRLELNEKRQNLCWYHESPTLEMNV